MKRSILFKGPWERDGTLLVPVGIRGRYRTEIDIRLDKHGNNWITVKGVTDAGSEAIAALLESVPELLSVSEELISWRTATNFPDPDSHLSGQQWLTDITEAAASAVAKGRREKKS